MPDSGLADDSVLTSTFYDTYVREQVVVTCTSGTRPSGVAGRLIYETDTDRLLVYTGSAWEIIASGAGWTSFTPTWTNLTLGTSPTQAWYYRYVGGDLRVRGQTTLGTGGAVTGSLSMALPDGATAGAFGHNDGIAWYFDATSTDSIGGCRAPGSASSILFYSSAFVQVAAAVPFTWAVNDSISADITVAL